MVRLLAHLDSVNSRTPRCNDEPDLHASFGSSIALAKFSHSGELSRVRAAQVGGPARNVRLIWSETGRRTRRALIVFQRPRTAIGGRRLG